MKCNQLPIHALCHRFHEKDCDMTSSITTKIAAALCVMLALSSCGNTIRGMGKDAANTVDATQNAGNRVGNAAAK
jgi:predicted small secreted protein